MTSNTRKRRGVQLLFAALGLGLLGVLVWTVGLTDVAAHMARLGWFAPIVLLPYAAIAVCDAKGWSRLIPRDSAARPVPLWYFSLSRLAGESINNLTPTASIGGEAFKVYLLRRRGIRPEVGMASVVAAKTALTVSQIIFILLGLPFFLFRLGWGLHSWWVMSLLMALACGFVLSLIHWQRRGLMEKLVRSLGRWFPRWSAPQRWEAGARRIDALLLQLYDSNPRAFLVSTLYHLLGWLLGAVEIWVIFALLGIPVGLIEALIIESMVQPLTAAALVIPGALGVRETAGVFLSRLLGIDIGAGLALMVLKRAREAVYNGIGLLFLTRAGYTWRAEERSPVLPEMLP